jgi:hypothetical protein
MTDQAFIVLIVSGVVVMAGLIIWERYWNV